MAVNSHPLGPLLYGFLVSLASVAALLVAGFIVGTVLERRHFRSIKARNERLKTFGTSNLRRHRLAAEPVGAKLVTASVVMSVDHFRHFLASIRMIFGGRIQTYERLVRRARQEALLRIREAARRDGAASLINVRFETSGLADLSRGIGGVEVLAYGTALRFGASGPRPYKFMKEGA